MGETWWTWVAPACTVAVVGAGLVWVAVPTVRELTFAAFGLLAGLMLLQMVIAVQFGGESSGDRAGELPPGLRAEFLVSTSERLPRTCSRAHARCAARSRA